MPTAPKAPCAAEGRVASPPDATLDWGGTAYADALARQLALVGRRIAGEVGDLLVLTEHEPVYTLGARAGARDHLLWDEDRLRAEGIAVEVTGRGGDITYHGPGQLVGYPVVGLDGRRDLHAYLRFLEEVLIAAVTGLGLSGAGRRPGLTGVWVGTRKVAALGVAVRRWVSYHGFALNVDPDLGAFAGIVPCGIAAPDGTVTSLRREMGPAADLSHARVADAVASAFWRGLPGFLGA